MINIGYFSNLIPILAPLPQIKPGNRQVGHVFQSKFGFESYQVVALDSGVTWHQVCQRSALRANTSNFDVLGMLY